MWNRAGREEGLKGTFLRCNIKILWASLKGRYWASLFPTDVSVCKSCSAPWRISYFIADCVCSFQAVSPLAPFLLSFLVWLLFFSVDTRNRDVLSMFNSYILLCYFPASHNKNLFLRLLDLFLLVNCDWSFFFFSLSHPLMCIRGWPHHNINWLCYHRSLYFCIFWELLLQGVASLSFLVLFLKPLILQTLHFSILRFKRLYLIQRFLSNPSTICILLELFISTLKVEENKQYRWWRNMILSLWFLSTDMLPLLNL